MCSLSDNNLCTCVCKALLSSSAWFRTSLTKEREETKRGGGKKEERGWKREREKRNGEREMEKGWKEGRE